MYVPREKLGISLKQVLSVRVTDDAAQPHFAAYRNLAPCQAQRGCVVILTACDSNAHRRGCRRIDGICGLRSDLVAGGGPSNEEDATVGLP